MKTDSNTTKKEEEKTKEKRGFQSLKGTKEFKKLLLKEKDIKKIFMDIVIFII